MFAGSVAPSLANFKIQKPLLSGNLHNKLFEKLFYSTVLHPAISLKDEHIFLSVSIDLVFSYFVGHLSVAISKT